MEHIDRPEPRAALSVLPDRREPLEARLRQAEAFLRGALEKLGAAGDYAGNDAADAGSVLDPSSDVLVAEWCDEASGCDGPPPADGAPSILIVDLHEASRAALGELFRASGYPVLEAGSSRDLPPDDATPPLLIVFDPGPHLEAGLRTVARMRIEDTSPVPVVLLSATFTPEQRDRALAIGCSELLEKPCMPAELLAVVAGLVGPPRVQPETPSAVARAW
ncbi:MAG TPA: response regulator [Longimicrobium sp.]|jgi:CheY-like chemotaxis protein